LLAIPSELSMVCPYIGCDEVGRANVGIVGECEADFALPILPPFEFERYGR